VFEDGCRELTSDKAVLSDISCLATSSGNEREETVCKEVWVLAALRRSRMGL
jgi:hypothetical protein